MKKLKASRKNDEDWSMRFVDDGDYDLCVNEDVFISREDGSPLLVLLKNKVPNQLNALAWSSLKSYNPKTDYRSVASGIKVQKRIKQDGTRSKVNRVPKGWEVVSGLVGFFERTVRTPYAHACAWNEQNPEKFARLFPLINFVDKTYSETVPEKWRQQRAIADRTPKEWLIGESTFTTVTINKNFRTSCHLDAGDLPEGFSCMSIITQGQFTGGRLVLPNYRIAAQLDHGDLVMFDPHEFHGNTRIVPISKDYLRCSIVYYFREKLQFCKSPIEELRFAQNRKEGQGLYDK